MPEDHNRVIIDHISEYLFAPTQRSRAHLEEDDVRGSIFLTGNTIVEALNDHISIAQDRSTILEDLELGPGDYLLVTMHREENVDIPSILAEVIDGLEMTVREFSTPVLFPVHPRTRARLSEFGLLERLTAIDGLRVIEPVGYFDFLMLLSSARVVLTDSGGIQEESCILGVPCVTLRENTERPETVEAGANIIAGTGPESLIGAVARSLEKDGGWENPFGDGLASQRIVDVSLDGTTEEWQPAP
jgi:UDP-N-acetylglucosamine 2-epimerase (non-hydrolysing)